MYDETEIQELRKLLATALEILAMQPPVLRVRLAPFVRDYLVEYFSLLLKCTSSTESPGFQDLKRLYHLHQQTRNFMPNFYEYAADFVSVFEKYNYR